MESIISNIPHWLLTPLVIGFLLDAIIGDPYWLPHPIRLFGKLIESGEKLLNKGNNKILNGGILTLALSGMAFAFFMAILFSLKSYPILKLCIESILVFYGIANRNLVEECLKVEKALNKKGLEGARKQLSTIVGRDTDKLSENKVRIASLETISENLSDGVIAPLFYFAIGGVPLMFAYKMVNTLDSMIGYKNERFKDFGKIAARTDDILNFIPARLTAFLMVFLSLSWRGFVFIFRYGDKHSSPNAGYPEAALAGILNCRFGGANYYHGKLVEKPFIGSVEKELSKVEIIIASIINMTVSLVFVLLIILFNTSIK